MKDSVIHKREQLTGSLLPRPSTWNYVLKFSWLVFLSSRRMETNSFHHIEHKAIESITLSGCGIIPYTERIYLHDGKFLDISIRNE